MATYSADKFKALYEASSAGIVNFSSTATVKFAAECYGDPKVIEGPQEEQFCVRLVADTEW